MNTQKTNDEWKMLYGALEEAVQELTPKQKTWVENNWKSLMERFAEQLTESAESSTEESEMEEFNCTRCSKDFKSWDGEECPHCGYVPRLDGPIEEEE